MPGELLAEAVVEVLPDPAALLVGDAEDFEFEPPPLGDVADDAGEDRPPLQLHLAHGEVEGERAAVFAAARHLPPDADDAAAAGLVVGVEIAVVLLVVGLGHEHADVLPDHLGGSIAEDARGRRVERLDRPLRVDRDDAVDGRFEDGAGERLALAERSLRDSSGSARRERCRLRSGEGSGSRGTGSYDAEARGGSR